MNAPDTRTDPLTDDTTPLPTVTLYTRAGCCLCDSAKADLLAVKTRHDFRLETVDVDEDPDLVARYGDCVPVVALNGRIMFRGRVNPRWLALRLRALKSAQADRAG